MGLTVANLHEIVENEYAAIGRKSIKDVPRRFRAAEAFFGSKAIDEINLGDLHAFARSRREAGIAPGTIKVELANLHHGCVLAIRLKKLLPTSMPEFPRLRFANARRVFLDRPILESLLEHLPGHLRPVFLTALLTGWRKRAILSRQWGAVDFDAGWLQLEDQNSKNGEPVRVPLIPALREILLMQRERARKLQHRTQRIVSHCFFYWEDSAHFKAGARIINFDHAWTAAREAAGLLGHVRFHDIRRGAIRTLRRAGASEHEVMEWVGLKTRHVFDAYDIIDEERRREVGAKLQGYFEGQAGQRSTLVGFTPRPSPMAPRLAKPRSGT